MLLLMIYLPKQQKGTIFTESFYDICRYHEEFQHFESNPSGKVQQLKHILDLLFDINGELHWEWANYGGNMLVIGVAWDR